MNPSDLANKGKRDKFLCGCCAKPEEFNSDEVIFDYFGREFTEYEYVIENLAIRPAPKKLLDLVPVHSTDISKVSISQSNHSHPSQPKMLSHYPNKQPTSGEGDFRKPRPNYGLKIRDVSEDYISFKAADEDYHKSKNQPKPFGPQMMPQTCPPHPRVMRDISEIQKTIKTKEYRTTKQFLRRSFSRKIITDLCRASEESLKFHRPIRYHPNHNQFEEKTLLQEDERIPSEIKETIDTLRFRRPSSQYHHRMEKRLFHTPGVYFAELKNDEQGTKGIKKTSEDSLIDLMPESSIEPSPSEKSRYYSVDSTAQTEISKACSCPKKQENKKNLKWKIIINKHAGDKCDGKCAKKVN